MATKKQLIEKLTLAGIPHDPESTVPTLKALLHPEDQSIADTVDEKSAPKSKIPAELQAKWDEFLAKAEEQRKKDGTHEIFLAQKERGEFDTIPRTFLDNHNIRAT